MQNSIKEPVVCHQGVLHIPHLGFTLRSLMGAAMANYEKFPQKIWEVHYKGAHITDVRLGKDFQ